MTTWSEAPQENEAVDALTRMVCDLAETLHKISDARYTDPEYGFVIDTPAGLAE
ncbi:hypothetical protein [Nocardia vaccinii]|uniref:hypothetical protein n=1 Tax=Nocardia vaccinii TaxID=1822 RepID=UPI000AA67D6D|nr:hypothetical protein [Nocardia vaccinii]